MRDDAMPFDGFDEFDPWATACLTCHIEMQILGGLTPREVAATTAETLRSLAARIEAGLLDTGHHPVHTSTGSEAGEIYLDFFGEG